MENWLLSLISSVVGGLIALGGQWVMEEFRRKKDSQKSLSEKREKLYLELGDFMVNWWSLRDISIKNGEPSTELKLKINSFKTRNEVYASEIVKNKFTDITGKCLDPKIPDAVIILELDSFYKTIRAELNV